MDALWGEQEETEGKDWMYGVTPFQGIIEKA
jgi:hypothetical protein